jgi:hypothetical protein
MSDEPVLKPIRGASLVPEPAITTHVDGVNVTVIGIVWNAHQAEVLFNLYHSVPCLILCIKVPMCRYVSDVMGAVAFFNDEGWQG